MTDNIITELERIIKENEELKTKLAEMEIKQRNSYMRERLYQSELSTIKSQLDKFAKGIKTTPHSHDAEYSKVVYQDGGTDNDK